MAIAMGMLAFSPAHADNAAPCTAYNDPTNPQSATCNGTSGSSKLFPMGSTGDKVTIFAPELPDPNNVSSGSVYDTCHTIINSDLSGKSYFIPWSHPQEWSAFLKAVGAYTTSKGIPSNDPLMSSVVTTSGCCVPMQLTQVWCPQSGSLVDISGPPLVLGGRKVGAPLTNGVPDNAVGGAQTIFDEAAGTANAIANHGLGNWGAKNDTTQSATVTHDKFGNPVNFEISFSCKPDLVLNPTVNDRPITAQTAGYGPGGWVEMAWSGSCAPADGACAVVNGTLSALPQDLTSLCATGSVIDLSSIVTTPTGWTWTCKGTGGSGCAWDPGGICQDKQCTATGNNPPVILGSCGSEAWIYDTIVPSDYPNLCATGTMANFDTSGTVLPGYQFTWQCLNSDGSTTSPAQNNCAAHNNDGWCGSADGSNQPNLTTSSSGLCNGGVLANFSTDETDPRAPAQNGYPGPFWWWNCLNSDGSMTSYAQNTCGAFKGAPNDAQCNNITAAAGGLGFTAAQMGLLVTQCDLTPAACQLCSQGVYHDGSLTSGFKNTQIYWNWQCDGTNNGGNASCTNDALNANTNGSCGTDNNKTFTSMTPGPTNLCRTANGITETPAYDPTTWFNSTTNMWNWQCNGFGLGTVATCKATYNPNYVIPMCGSASGTSVDSGYTYQSPPPTAALCSPGTASGIGETHNYGWSYDSWTWTCNGSNRSTPVGCEADVPAPPPAVCGAASGACTVGTPSSVNCQGNECSWNCTYPNGEDGNPLGDIANCTIGSPTPGVCGLGSGACATGALVATPHCDSSNPPNCTWQCQGSNDTPATACTGTGLGSTLDPNGICGLADGLPSYVIPNQNLCSKGILLVPPGVTGSGPWTWTCQGSQTNSPPCNASICTQCTGNLTRNNSASWAVTGTVNGCTVTTATATWTETDDLAPSSNVVTGVISGSMSLGNFSFNVAPGSPAAHTPTYCSPCYMELNKAIGADGVSNFSITVSGKDAGGANCSQPLSSSVDLQ
jgi:hypothetical protein